MALQVLSAFTATQPVGASLKVNFGFTATDADNDTLSLAYAWKKQSGASYTAATTTAPSTVAATSGGVAVTGVWDLDADYIGNELAVPLTLQVTSTRAAIAALGSLTAVAANATTGIKEADTFTIGGRVYEFTTDATIVGGRVPVTLATATDSNALVKAAILLAINGDATATVTAASGAGQLINLTAKVLGIAGNTAIAQSISNSATLTPVGMTGGVDPQVVISTADVTANTGTGPLPATVVSSSSSSSKFDFSDRVIEGRGNEYGAVAQGNMFGSYAKKVLETVASNVREFVRVYGDRNLRNERAVLVNPDFYTANLGSGSFTIVVKPVAWFTDIASRTLSDDRHWANNTIYAIVRTNVKQAKSAGVLVQQSSPVLGYLMSATQFNNMVN